MLLIFVSNLNGNVGTYIIEKYENGGVGLSSNNTQPQGVHIAFGEDPCSSITILWSTEAYVRSKVKYGKKESKLFRLESPATSQKFIETNEYGSHYKYRTLITGLEPDTLYHYKIVAGTVAASNVFSFRTVPSLNRYSSFKPSFLVFGDYGLDSIGFDAVVKEALTGKYHAVLHLGDIAYNLFSMRGILGDRYLKAIEPFAASFPYMTVPGDHESPAKFIHYRYRFSMPGVPWPMPEEKLWYSTNVGNVHLISYNTEAYFHSTANIERQFAWLVEDLHTAVKSRSRQPWIIVLGHKPLYCSQKFPQDCNASKSKLRDGVEELFYTFGVDLVLQGHCHSYERSFPMYKGKVLGEDYKQPKGPVYITTGTTGNQYITDTISSTEVRSPWSAFLMSRTEKESFGRLLVHNDSVLSWDEVLTSNGKVIDSIVIEKPEHKPYADVESFIRRAQANQTMENLLLGQNLSVARGDFSGWKAASVMMFAFALVVLLFLFRVAVVEILETGVHRIKYIYRKHTGQLKKPYSRRTYNNYLI